MARVGYTRVSSEAQNLDRQLDSIALDKVFADKVSGKDTQRPKLDEMLDYVRDGDTVVVHSMDRLARNLDDLRQLVRSLTDRGVRQREPDLHRRRLTYGHAAALDHGVVR